MLRLISVLGYAMLKVNLLRDTHMVDPEVSGRHALSAI